MKLTLKILSLFFCFSSSLLIGQDSLKDSTVYHYYINQASVQDVIYVDNYYKNGNQKENGWLIKIDREHDLEELPNDITPGTRVSFMKVGKYIEYHKNGNIKSIRTTSLNKTDSIHIEHFDKEGLRDSEVWFPHKKLCNCKSTPPKNYTGFHKYYENNKLVSQGNIEIISFKEVGIWYYFDLNGDITYTETYDNGKVVKTETF